MLTRRVFNDFQNNIIVNNSRSKHEKCILNTARMVVWFENKIEESFISFIAEPGCSVTAVLLITLM